MTGRNKVILYNDLKLMVVSMLTALICCVCAFALKWMTEHFQHELYSFAVKNNGIWLIIFPTCGITTIYFLRKYLFRNRKNKGITEIYKTLDQRKDHLALFKLPSHLLNGFFTVVFGGSTGIEVSTVVATATVGNEAYKRDFSAKMYKRELVSAGVVAGVGVLFGSPLVGLFFALEVIARKVNRSLLIACLSAGLAAWIFILAEDSKPLLPFEVQDWAWKALPFFVLLSLFGALLSVYFTILVIRIKDFFGRIPSNFLRVNLGALLVGLAILCLPFLYGDSYHGLIELIKQVLSKEPVSLLIMALLIFIKPLVAALTLGAGGDGGVFAPSIVVGAVLGLFFALTCNRLFNTELIPLNFALAGVAATLSSAISAPFTALILVCNLVPNGYVLFLPLLISSFLAQRIAKFILPYNVYTYGGLENPSSKEI
ncbi:chloride channel protein [uncultured Fluviicola sp.]|uniref:chloride channel protein n=1 Tax=uncultured Fluviicola sp. TaxID=463303 RepID=UPI0025ECEABB|nr:chloride channel protein [uncultured Fluviicola sp.]